MMRNVRLTAAAGVAFTLLLGGCSVQHRPKQQFAGKLLSQDAVCPPTQATLIIQNDQIVFSPADTTWLLQGKSLSGKIDLVRSRPSFDHRLYTTTLTATLSDDHVIGTYSTPSCVYAVDLSRF